MVSVASRHFMVMEFTDITAPVYRWYLPVVNEVLCGVGYISDTPVQPMLIATGESLCG